MYLALGTYIAITETISGVDHLVVGVRLAPEKCIHNTEPYRQRIMKRLRMVTLESA